MNNLPGTERRNEGSVSNLAIEYKNPPGVSMQDREISPEG